MHFRYHNKVLFDLQQFFHFEKFEGSGFRYDLLFLNGAQKYPMKAFLVTNLQIFISEPNLDKFKYADCKYDISFSKLNSKNTQIRHFWSHI